MGSEVPINSPPPAAAMSRSTNVPQKLPPQVPERGDLPLFQNYPIIWRGVLTLKSDQAAVQMHFVSGDPTIATTSLPPSINGKISPLRITQRMRLDSEQVEGVQKKIRIRNEHCILVALPSGKDHMDVLQQASNLKTRFIHYFQSKQAAGIIVAVRADPLLSTTIIHIFHSCEFTDKNLSSIAPDLLQPVSEVPHLVIIITTD